MWSESKPEGLGSGFFSEDWIRVISTRNPAKKKVCPPIQKMLKNRERECHGIYSRWFIQNMFTVITKGHIFELFNTLNIRALQTEQKIDMLNQFLTKQSKYRVSGINMSTFFG